MKMLRIISCVLLAIILLAGCTGKNDDKPKEYDPKHNPALHIEHYEKLSGLIGAERLTALKEMGYELSDTTFEHWWAIELPLKATIAGVDFSVHLSIEDGKDGAPERLQSFSYQKNYQYSTEKDAAIREIMAVCKELNDKLGAPDAVDSWNDQWEEAAATELDKEIPAWQSEEQLCEILEHEFGWGGCIMSWDVTGYCTESYKQFVESKGWELKDVIQVDVQRWGEDSIQFTIYF